MDDTNKTPQTTQGEVTLLDYLMLLARHSRLIILTVSAITVLAYLLFFTSPNQFTATARFLPPQENLSMSGHLMDIVGGGVKPGGPGGGGLSTISYLFGLKSPGDLFVGMLTGETILNRIIERFDLKELYNKKTLVDTRKELKKQARIRVDKKDGLIVIEVTDEKATRAAEMAAAFIEELDKLLQDLTVQEASVRLTFLEKERAQAGNRLLQAEENLRHFSEKNSVIQMDTQTKSMLHYISQLRADIDAKEVQAKVLRKQATPYNYDVVLLETQIKGLKEKLQAAEKQWDQACLGEVCMSTDKMPSLGMEYVRLYREVKYQESLHQLFTKLVEVARLDLVRDVSVIQVVDRPTPPDKRSNKRLLPTLMVALAALLVMTGVVLLREYLNQAPHREANREQLADLKGALGPWLASAKRKSELSRKPSTFR